MFLYPLYPLWFLGLLSRPFRPKNSMNFYNWYDVRFTFWFLRQVCLVASAVDLLLSTGEVQTERKSHCSNECKNCNTMLPFGHLFREH